MTEKIIAPVIVILLLVSGIIAVTQETPDRARDFLDSPVNVQPPQEEAEEVEESRDDEISGGNVLPASAPDWVKAERWFRSNQSGMALEEMPSQLTALRNEYALSVGFTQKSSLPDNIIPYYEDGYFIEVRVLYENSEVKRTQWIYRDIRGLTRMNAVFSKPSQTNEKEQNEGFIETYDRNSFLIMEYNFLKDGKSNRIDYNYKDGLLISCKAFLQEYDEEELKEDYEDFFRYNRSSFLRVVERVFLQERQILLAGEPLRVSFPKSIKDAALPDNLASEKLNSYPEFFGDVFVEKNDKIVYITDERSRIISQTFYDEEGSIIWVIHNTWQNDRIVSTSKTEGSKVSLAEFEYNSAGDRILEKNYTNGVLERLVRTEGKREIEELYLNDVVVLQAVWEDGRKISETRTGSR